MKIKRYITALFAAILLTFTMTSCEKADDRPVHSDVTIYDAYIGDNMAEDNRLIKGDQVKDKITFYVSKADQQEKHINIKSVLIKVEIGIDASVSPKLIGRQNLSKPMQLTITAGDKTKKVYTLEAILEE